MSIFHADWQAAYIVPIYSCTNSKKVKTSLQVAAAMVNFGDEKASVVHVLGFVATFQRSTETSRLSGMGLGHFEPVQEESMPCACLSIC